METGTAMRAENLTKSYGPKEAARGVDLEVEWGILYRFLGPNGAVTIARGFLMMACLVGLATLGDLGVAIVSDLAITLPF